MSIVFNAVFDLLLATVFYGTGDLILRALSFGRVRGEPIVPAEILHGAGAQIFGWRREENGTLRLGVFYPEAVGFAFWAGLAITLVLSVARA